MSRLTAILDWIDDAAGGLIRLAYLLAGITAVAVYFGAGHLPAVLDNALNAGLPWALAFAVETHTYVTSRRVRVAWQDRQASTRGTPARERATGALWVNLAILAALLAFSAWNQLGYLAATWAPPSTFLPLPAWASYVVRALIVPLAFMAAAFLAPTPAPISAQLENEARATLADVFKIARAQRKRLLAEAERSGRDMTGALVELVPDPEARRIIAHAYGAIRGDAPILPALPVPALPLPAPAHATEAPHGAEATMAVDSHPAIAAPASARTDADPAPTEKPPTGPGSPAVQRARKRRRVQTPRTRKAPAVLRLEPVPAEERIRAAVREHPGASVKQLAEAAGTSSATASKWRKVIAAEQSQASQQLAQ